MRWPVVRDLQQDSRSPRIADQRDNTGYNDKFHIISITTTSLDMSAVSCAVCRDVIVTWRTHGSHRLCSKGTVYDAWVKLGICGWCFKSGEKSPMAAQSHATFRRENLTCTQASIDVWYAGLWYAQAAHYLLCTCVGMFGVMDCGVYFELYHFPSCLTYQHNSGGYVFIRVSSWTWHMLK